MRRLLWGLSILTATAQCGNTPPHLGIALDELRIRKSLVGPAPTDIATNEFAPGSTRRIKRADVAGDQDPEELIEMVGAAGVDIRSRAGQLLAQVPTKEYLTDFGAVRLPGRQKESLVLYTYPNPEKGGTFIVFDERFNPLASWTESPPPGRFAVGQWNDRPALFYLQGDSVTVRSATGEKLASLSAPEGQLFRGIHVHSLAGGRLAVVASGNGYTPYHMTCIYEGERLRFREVAAEHAFALEPGDAPSNFIVSTRTSRWKYALRE
jgi:hypothetical protein